MYNLQPLLNSLDQKIFLFIKFWGLLQKKVSQRKKSHISTNIAIFWAKETKINKRHIGRSTETNWSSKDLES